jgi:hypothetical protein
MYDRFAEPLVERLDPETGDPGDNRRGLEDRKA